ADARGLANEVAAPEADVRADERLDQVENGVAEQELHQARVAKVDHVQVVLAVTSEILFEDRLQAAEIGVREHGPMHQDIALCLVVPTFFLGEFGRSHALDGSAWHLAGPGTS